MNRRLWIALYLAPFAAIFAFVGYFMPLWGRLIGEPCPLYNSPKEGAIILSHKSRIQSGEFPPGYDIFVVGTSRTMADVNADKLASRMAEKMALKQKPTAFNLGNVGYDSRRLNQSMKGKSAPKILIVEYGVGSFDLPKPVNIHLFHRYSRSKVVNEWRFAGALTGLAGLRSVFKIGDDSFTGLKSVATGGPVSMKDLYYYHLCAGASGQRWQNDGQVYFWSQLSGRRGGESCKKFFTEYSWFGASHRTSLDKNPAWKEFRELVAPYVKSQRLVIYKPPVDPKYYALQLKENPEIDKQMMDFIKENNIPLVDFNPNDYFSTDYSHLDWYETDRFTAEMADRIAPLINWDGFGPR